MSESSLSTFLLLQPLAHVNADGLVLGSFKMSSKEIFQQALHSRKHQGKAHLILP